MKPKLKIFKLIALFTLFSTFFSCQEDEISVENENQSFHLKTSRLSINQVINEITNKQIKQKLQITNLSSSHNNSLFRSNNSSDYFIKKEKDDELTTYILNLNSYSQLKPYFLKLIITKNKNETEKMGFLKYIPTNPVSSLDLTNFTGKIEILDTNFQINATSEYVNGIKQISNQSNGISNRMICTDELLITEVKCSHTGNHGVGETCNNGYINDAYYVVSIFTRCNGDRTTPSQIIEDTSNPTGGTSSFSNTAYLYSFVDNLSQEELLIYVTNPSIQNYLVQNLIIAPIPNCDPMLGGDCTHIIIKPEVEQFVNELIGVLAANPQPIYTSTDYPGKNNGMPFEWWKDNDYMTSNFEVLEEDPNPAELLAFSLFPDKALLHIQNSTTALNKTQQLVLNNTLTGIEDGRADAFRHAYWNALGTAEFGSNITQIFTDAHEAYSNGLSKQMDLHNNLKGREKALIMSFNFLTSDSVIADSILIEVYVGHLLFILNGVLTPTD